MASPLPLQGTNSRASAYYPNTPIEKESDSEPLPIFTGTRTTEIEVTHGSWENGTVLTTTNRPYPPQSEAIRSPNSKNDPDSNYRVTISALPNATLNSRTSRRQGTGANSLDKIKWAYTKVAMLFAISILITWVPASVNRVYGLRYPEKPSFVLNILSAIVLPLQGFVSFLSKFYTAALWVVSQHLESPQALDLMRLICESSGIQSSTSRPPSAFVAQYGRTSAV
jgi:hypothetical protein